MQLLFPSRTMNSKNSNAKERKQVVKYKEYKYVHKKDASVRYILLSSSSSPRPPPPSIIINSTWVKYKHFAASSHSRILSHAGSRHKPPRRRRAMHMDIQETHAWYSNKLYMKLKMANGLMILVSMTAWTFFIFHITHFCVTGATTTTTPYPCGFLKTQFSVCVNEHAHAKHL